jgi:hypothetical protein
VSRIARNFLKCFGTGAKQEIVENLLVLQNQWHQPVRQCEDDVHVAGRKEFPSTRSNPSFPSSDLTLRAVAIATRIEGDGLMPAAGALVEMTAECGGTTPRNGHQHFEMRPPDPFAVSFDEGRSRGADDIGHLKGWPIHLLLLRWFVFPPQRVQWTHGRVEVTFGEMQVLAGLFQIVMA